MKKFVTLLMVIAGTAHAESYEDLVERAFEAMENDVHAHWAFTETRTNSEGTFVATFDPEREDQWQLLTVDGRAPTEDELEEFLGEKAGERGDGNGRNETNMDDDSLALLEETDDYFLFSFVPTPDDDDESDFLKYVDARLKVMKSGPYVAEISMRNDGPIKPGKGVKIKTFVTELEFAPAEEGGPVLPQRVYVEIKGRAMLVIGFDEQESVEFTDYQRRPAHP